MDQDEELSQSLSDLSRSLSSEELSAEELSINIQYCHDKISEYTPRNNKDLTKPILGSFIDNLPPDGNRVLCQHILDKTTDQDDLYRLGDHGQGNLSSKLVWLPFFFVWFANAML